MGGVTRAFIYSIAAVFFMLGIMTGVFISALVTSAHADGTTMAPLSDMAFPPRPASEPTPAVPSQQWKLTVTVIDTNNKPVDKLRYTGQTWDTRAQCEEFSGTDKFAQSLKPLAAFLVQQGYAAYSVDFACEPVVDSSAL